MNRQKGFHFNIGTASVILVLLVFVLAAFSVRSIKAANHELKLADKSVASIQEYYAADSEAENIIYLLNNMMRTENEKQWEKGIAEINQQFEGVYDIGEIVMDKTEEGKIFYTFAVKAGEKAKLQVKAEATEDKKCYVTEWRTIVEREDMTYNLEEDVELWDGNVDIEK